MWLAETRGLLIWVSSRRLRARLRKPQHEDGLAPLGLALPPRSATSGSEQFDGLKSSLPGQSPKSGGARTSASKYRPPVETVLRFKRGTSELRPGERLTLLRLMKDMYVEGWRLPVVKERRSCAG